MLHWVDWLIIVAYLVFSMVVGVVFSRRAGRSMKEYFVSGRNLPWWLAGTSMVATSFAADTPLYVTGLVRRGGISENWYWWSFATGGMLSVFLLSRLWRRAGIVTDVELTEMRYSGKSAAALRAFKGAYFALVVNSITMAWVILAMVKLLKEMFGLHPVASVAALSVITTLYCMMSGLWGVVVTDLVQFVLAMAGSVTMAALAVRAAGGLDALSAKACQTSSLGPRLVQFFPRFPEGVSPGELRFWEGPFGAFLVYIAVQGWINKNSDGGGVIVQRQLSSRNEKHALLATLWFNVAHYALRPWPWILVALASVTLLPEITDAEAAYPAMIVRVAPAGVMGLVIASFLAAFMSTIDTTLNLSSSYMVNDVYRRFLVRTGSERHYVWVGRVASVGFMALGAVIALVNDSINAMFTFMVMFTGGAGLVYLGRWFWWRLNAWSEISAIVASGVIAILLTLDGSLSRHMQFLVTIVGSAAVWLTVTMLTPPVEKVRLVEFYRRVRPYGWWGSVAEEAGVEPARGFGMLIVNWMAGTVMVLAAMIGVGKFLMGDPMWGWGCMLLAAVCGTVVAREAWREDRASVVTEMGQGPM